MVKKFSDHEKELIRDRLLERGKELFGTFGLKKTSIEELTKAAGIAQGTFYLFYNSKEELYFDLLQKEEEQFRNRMLQEHLGKGLLTRDAFKRFLREALSVFETNPFLRQMLETDTMQQVMRKLPPDVLEKHLARDIDVFQPLIAGWQREGGMARLSPDLIVSVIRALVILSLQKRLIGEPLYRQTIELYIDFVTNGLLKKEADPHD